MSYKWIGAMLIVGSCTGFGVSLAVHQKREELLLRQLIRILDEMLWELPYQLTPLPELIRHAVEKSSGAIRFFFRSVADQLDRQVLPDVLCCVEAELKEPVSAYPRVKKMILLLGSSLGRFDLAGQLKGLTAVKEQCACELRELHTDREPRLRSYRVLGLCAGAALAILLI